MSADPYATDYLWNPHAAPDADVEAVERQLASLRFDPAARPLVLPATLPDTAPGRSARRTWRRPVVALALAASLLIAAGAGLWSWRWQWPEGRPWTVRASSFETSLAPNESVTVPQGDEAVANIARIGTLRMSGGTELQLRATHGIRHRMRLTEGSVHVRVWAPPGSVAISTPAGEVVDMGCEFLLDVDGGTSRVRVLSGWVQMENGVEEVLIPAGASSVMTQANGPSVPVFDDAAPAFHGAVGALERDPEDAQLGDLLRHARPRDVYTLLRLAGRHPDQAEPLLRHAATLFAPPRGVTVDGILRGDRRALWVWSDALPLPPPKSGWWRNWRDALPFWLTAR